MPNEDTQTTKLMKGTYFIKIWPDNMLCFTTYFAVIIYE